MGPPKWYPGKWTERPCPRSWMLSHQRTLPGGCGSTLNQDMDRRFLSMFPFADRATHFGVTRLLTHCQVLLRATKPFGSRAIRHQAVAAAGATGAYAGVSERAPLNGALVAPVGLEIWPWWSKPMGSHLGEGSGSKPMVPFWLAGKFTTHFRTYSSGDWDVHLRDFDPWPYGVCFRAGAVFAMRNCNPNHSWVKGDDSYPLILAKSSPSLTKRQEVNLAIYVCPGVKVCSQDTFGQRLELTSG